MNRTVYVNGEYVPEHDARISVFDRGFLFADAVYEVTAVLDGKLVEFEPHITRLERSLSELGMPMPCDADALLAIHRELVSRNAVTEGLVYLQVSRGAADRDFAFPAANTEQTLVLFTQHKNFLTAASAETGISVISLPDKRWGRRDIKTVQLLYPSLAKMEAKQAGADDAWMVDDIGVTEGSSNNAYIVLADGRIVTRNLGHDILPGITRRTVLKCAGDLQLTVEERPFSLEEAADAVEAFYSSATGFVTPVVALDGKPIGDGKPGPVTRRLREIYIQDALQNAI
ncbi:MAG: D-amino-acid transaminase [Pseudomonadota bacterium]